MTKKDDEILAQLEAIRNEMKEGKQQTASAVAVETYKNEPFINLKFRHYKFVLLLIVLIFVAALAGVGTYKLFAGAEPKVEKGSIIEQMNDLSSLASSQAIVKAVIEKEDNQIFGIEIKGDIPGTKRKILLIVPGTVTAGVDLDDIDGEHVSINEDEKTIAITLPHAEIIQEPSLEFEQVQTYSVEGIFRAEVDWEEAYELAAEAKTLVKEEAIAQGLLQLAETNAEKTLKEFYSQLGYEVSVKYED